MNDARIAAPLPARNQVISGLRQLADYLDQHPGVPVDEHGWDLLVFARQPIPFGPDYRKWRADRAAAMAMGKEIAYCGEPDSLP